MLSFARLGLDELSFAELGSGRSFRWASVDFTKSAARTQKVLGAPVSDLVSPLHPEI